MKKILLVALAAAAMVGCSQNEEFDNATTTQKKAMKFNTAVMNTTRGTVITSTNFKEFNLYAYQGATEIIGGTKFTGPGTWTAAGAVFYWPGEQDVNFYGYAGSVTYNSNSAAPTLDYEVKTTIADQEDVLVSKLTAKSTTNDGKVALSFSHALAKISFKVKGEGTSDVEYKVQSIKVNAFPSGTYTYSTDSWGTPTGTKVDYLALDAESSGISGGTTASLGEVLMLMPQNGATITVTYTCTTNGISTPVTPKSYTLTEAWGKGSNTSYLITLDGAKKMTISGSLGADWDSEPTTDTEPTI